MDTRLAVIEKYRVTPGDLLKLGIKRNIYLDKLFEFVGTPLIKVIVGQRRTGKSFLLRQVALRLQNEGVQPENIVYINKEFSDFDFLETYTELKSLYALYKEEYKVEGKTYWLIDEIQNIDGWERFVNSVSQDFREDCELFVSGSNSDLLSGELATLLSGRYIVLPVFTFGYQEYITANNLPDGRNSYLDYMQKGGFPEFINLPLEESRKNYVSAIKDSVLLRDVIQRYKIKEAQLLEDIFIFLVNNASNLISVSNIVGYFASKKRKTNYETISTYITYLSNAYIIHKADRYNIRGKETISGNCKYYINDVAFRNYLYQGYGYGAGYLLENTVYLELRRLGFEVYTGVFGDKEVDFVALKGDRKIYLQAC
ncbi:MAG TPA: ATP-binding protein, partial [Prolixibacteraceae bacterium]|nr:ATP-binding protein [Prolixibacteraceae bacterium]